MVLIESLDSFVEQAEALHKQNPLKSRYVIKYSHCKGKLTLKVTDDRNTVQYKTDQQSDLKKVLHQSHLSARMRQIVYPVFSQSSLTRKTHVITCICRLRN